MHEYWHVILESLLHTVKILPFLFIIYYLIQLLEFKCAVKFANNRLFKGKASPLFGSLIGCIPQCGFSVISTDLFTKKSISIGALIAVYIATSDEAIPIMISNPKSIGWMIALIGIKVVVGIAIGYLSIWIYNLIFKNKEHLHKKENHNSSHIHEHEEEHNHEEIIHGGCCKHDVEHNTFNWWHPMFHCLKICFFILLVNILFGFITHIWIGEANLIKFLTNSLWLQPLLAVLIGLIPNCASSVVITELFLIGGVSFGALVAGLCVNAGLGLILLLKQNKNWKENLFIVIMLTVPSLILGYALNFINFI